MAADPNDKYDEKEAQRRFEAALRGARIAGHKPMKPAGKKKPAQPLAKKKKPGK
jgi:hypothetical protein